MPRAVRAIAGRTLAVVAGSATLVFAQDSRRLAVDASVEPAFAVADHRFVDVDRAGGLELLVVGSAGEVRTWSWDPERKAFAHEPRGALVLAEPRRTLLALGSVLDHGGPPDLVSASPRGVEAFPWTAEQGFGVEPVVLAGRARMRWRVGRPTFASIVQDVNGDGLQDFVMPTIDALELWIQGPRAAPADEAASDGAPRGASSSGRDEEGPRAAPPFRRAASVAIDLSVVDETDAEELSDRLQARFSVPALALQDVNGDGRDDLRVEQGEVRAFHLVRADGSIPTKPDVSVDLALFRDTTPEAALKPGRTLAGGDAASWQSRDLDRDGIPDYVIAHRRKVWVFRGRPEGPQFTEPATILKAADDVTALTLLALDDDAYPDLLLFKVQVPSIASLLRGLVREWEVEIGAIGYRNLEGSSFDPTPRWKSTLALRVPAILSIVKDPGALLSRFENVGRQFRTPAEGDFDGDGAGDVALLSEDRARLDVWLGRERDSEASSEGDEVLLRRLLFEDEHTTWDVDRILDWLGGYAARRIATVTGGRAPDGGIALRDATAFTLETLEAGDPDGEGRAALLLRYGRKQDEARKAFDLVRMR